MTTAMRDAGEIPLGMTDLEERLQGSGGPELCKASMSRLAQLAATLDAKVDKGLPPDEYVRATEMKAAIRIAQSLLQGRF